MVWLLEEMQLAYRLRKVNLLAGVENDPEFLEINPGGFIPAIDDGHVRMVETIAIIEYLTSRYGPTPLTPKPEEPSFSTYLQFLHLGEAGLAVSAQCVAGARNFAPEADRDNWSARDALETFQSRMKLVTRQLSRTAYISGDTFTAADISVSYALMLARRGAGIELEETAQAYLLRTTARPSYRHALNTCQSVRAWLDRGTGI